MLNNKSSRINYVKNFRNCQKKKTDVTNKLKSEKKCLPPHSSGEMQGFVKMYNLKSRQHTVFQDKAMGWGGSWKKPVVCI